MPYISRIRDGEPHLAWFDRRTQNSFVWTGRVEDPIEVQPGGYGEPTTALLPLSGNALHAAIHGNALVLLTAFQATCEQWLASTRSDG